MTVFKYALLRGLRSPMSIVVNFALPLFLIFLRNLWEGDNIALQDGFSFIGLLILFGSFLTARGIMNDKHDGTTTRILAGPTTTFRYLSQNLLACMVPLTATIVVVVTIGTILYSWQLSFAFALILCYTIFAAACVALSFAWSCLFKSKEASFSIFSVLAMFMAALGGLILPLSMLPDILRYFGAIFPAYWAAFGLDILQNYGAAAGRFWLSLGAMALFAIAFLLYGGKRRLI